MSNFARLSRSPRPIVALFLVTFALAEMTLRVYNHFNPTFIFYDRSYNRFRGKPGAPDYDFNLNSRGFKDVEFTTAKDANTYRIVALGDSFAFGVVPYQYTYLTLLEDQLNNSGRGVEVLNMGIPNIGPQHYLGLLVEEGLQLKPDMVLVSFFIGNDFTDTVAGRKRVSDYSYVASLFKYVIDLNRTYEGLMIHGRAGYDDRAPTLTDDAYLRIEKDRSAIYLKREPLKKIFADTVGYLERIKELCDRSRIALTVVFIPDELQIDPALQATVLAALNVGSNELDFTLPNRFLSEQLQMRGIDHLDLLDAFSSAAAGLKLYRTNDSHWNIAGNKLAADLLARHVARRLEQISPAWTEPR